MPSTRKLYGKGSPIFIVCRTPFLDNYPTFEYIRQRREDEIPDLIDRSFYAYTSDNLSQEAFEGRFAQFQGNNNNVVVKYVPSDFIRESTDEMATLESLFDLEEQSSAQGFNALVDLCGVFKRSTIHDVRNLIRKKYGADRFRYVYHIDQADNSDRVLYMDSDNDVLYDEEFYRYLCNQYGANLRDRVFFFVDNRNVIGKGELFELAFPSFLYACDASFLPEFFRLFFRHTIPIGLPTSLWPAASDQGYRSCS